MLKAKLYTQEGTETGEIKLNPKIFDIPANTNLIHQAVVAFLSNQRLSLAHTKTRAEVAGGGKKPWKQKGTGRARHGSIRSPLWRGGGITFGPRNDRNYTKKLNKKMKRKALFMVLTDKVKENNLLALEKLEMPEAKTKVIKDLMKKLEMKKSVLLVIEKMDKNIVSAGRNIPKLEIITASSLNVYDVLKFNSIIVTEKALETIEKTFLKA